MKDRQDKATRRRPEPERPVRCPHCGEPLLQQATDEPGPVRVCPHCRLPLPEERLA